MKACIVGLFGVPSSVDLGKGNHGSGTILIEAEVSGNKVTCIGFWIANKIP